MKSKLSSALLLALTAFVGWASVEAYRLWVATQQVAASQELQMRVGAQVEAARVKQFHLANADAPVRGPRTVRK